MINHCLIIMSQIKECFKFSLVDRFIFVLIQSPEERMSFVMSQLNTEAGHAILELFERERSVAIHVHAVEHSVYSAGLLVKLASDFVGYGLYIGLGEFVLVFIHKLESIF